MTSRRIRYEFNGDVGVGITIREGILGGVPDDIPKDTPNEDLGEIPERILG